jgi:hypothetical protein
LESASNAFVNGDAGPWLTLTAEENPASIFGGFGGLGESGASTVHQRYLLAAGGFRPSGAVVTFDYRIKDVRGKLAYTVAIERANVLYSSQTERQELVLRATMIFRLQKGAWEIVHRHADDKVELKLPGAVGVKQKEAGLNL